MLHIVLFQPQIPQNTGNIGRMCALTRSRLHLIHPLGYKITDSNLKRAGMDYWRSLDVREHADWREFRAGLHAPRRLWLFTTRAERIHAQTRPEKIKAGVTQKRRAAKPNGSTAIARKELTATKRPTLARATTIA